LVATVISGSFRSLSACIGAPGPHDFAVREKRRSSAQRIALGTSRPPQSRSAFVTIAIRPSGERNGINEATDLGYFPNEIFFEAGLDDPNHVEFAWKISFWAQGFRADLATTLRRSRRAFEKRVDDGEHTNDHRSFASSRSNL